MIIWLRSLIFLAVGFLSAGIAAALILPFFWAPRHWLWAYLVGYCRFLVWSGDVLCGMKVVVEGRENLPDTPSVIMIKHSTALETYGHVPIFPRTAWVLKREILWVPIFGWAVGLLFRPIAINRRAGGPAVRQVIQKGKEKLANGTWVTIYPEGTRVQPGETRRYGVSGAALALEAGVPIVPVAHNAGDFWRRREFIKRPGTVRFCIGPPISAEGRPPKETNLIVQAWIEDKMNEISSVYQARRGRSHESE